MKSLKEAFNYATLSVLGAFLTNVFVFLGTPFLRLLRETYGSAGYLFAGAIISSFLLYLKLYPLAGVTIVMWAAVYLHRELSVRFRMGILINTLLVSLVLGSIAYVSLFLGVKSIGSNLHQTVGELVKQFLPTNNPKNIESIEMTITVLSQQLWSFLCILIGISLVTAEIMTPRLCKVMGTLYPRNIMKEQLIQFKAPDFFIFLVLISFFLSFFKGIPPNVAISATNLFNIVAAIYFFQGIAVSEWFLAWLRTGGFFRAVFYVFIVGNFFPVIALIGVIDYWIDFRKRWGVIRASHSESKR
jgi:hypothetical protein